MKKIWPIEVGGMYELTEPCWGMPAMTSCEVKAISKKYGVTLEFNCLGAIIYRNQIRTVAYEDFVLFFRPLYVG